MQPFTEVDGVEIVGSELGAHASQPLQQILARDIDIAHLGEIDEQSCRDYVLRDQRSCLRCPVPVERAFHLERWTTRKPPNFCSEHCVSSNRLDNGFSKIRASDLTTDHIHVYIQHRLKQGASNGTVNRELALLKRSLSLGRECTPPKVDVVPYIPSLREDNVRLGFLEPDEYTRLAYECAQAGLWMRALLEVGYSYGWRHGELLNMRVRQVDLLNNALRLDPGSTKNRQGREVEMTASVRELLTQCVLGKRADDHVFTRNGKAVRDFRVRWHACCVAAGVGELLCPRCGVATVDARCQACRRKWNRHRLKYSGLIFHDLRRTAVRGLVRAGVSEKVAQTITGHRTRSIFDRYHIVSNTDLREAVRKLEVSREMDFNQNSTRVAREVVQNDEHENPARLRQRRAN
jgi:integrase